MTNHHPHTTGETLEQLLERVTFADPATHHLRDEWEEAKRTEQAVFERVCQEEYEHRLEYHRICQTPEPEEAARREAALVCPLLHEELDGRLWVLWQDIVRRVNAVLADRRAETKEQSRERPEPGTGSAPAPREDSPREG
jgi:hypothetical protein